MTTVKDFRSFLKVLEENGELKRTQKKVDPDLEASSVWYTSEKEGGPAILFENVKGSKVKLVSGLLSSMDRVATAIKTTKEKTVEKIRNAMDNSIEPELKDDGPINENIIKDDFDVRDVLPIPVHAVGDGGPFISSGVCIGKDPENGRRNLSYNRMHVKGPKETGFHVDPWRHLEEFHQKVEEKGKPLDVAVCIGLDPSIELAAGARVPYDELELAGGLRGEPVEIVEGETIDVEYPANAEIVIEGKLLPEVRESEGPFAEFTGYYGTGESQPVFEISAVKHRNDPIYRTIFGASKEHLILGNVISREPVLHKFVSHVVPNLKAVHLPPHASGFHAVISIEKENEGMPKQAIMAAMTAHINIKHVTVVDEDIDIYDPKEVEWAIATRVQGDKDIMIIPGTYGHHLDRTTDEGVTAKVGIDATVPLDKKEDFVKAEYEEVDLSSYLKSGSDN